MTGVRIIARVALALTFCAMSAAGCDKNSASTTSATPPETRPVATQPVLALPDYVVNPRVDANELDSTPLRIVSAAPSVTEMCCALGLRNQLVGRTRYDVYPPGIEAVASIGALNDVNVEALLALRPDLILVSGHSRGQRERFEALNIRFESVPDTALDDLFAALLRIGGLTSRPHTAEVLCQSIKHDLATVDAHHQGASSARVLLLTGTLPDPPRPPYVAGPGSFYDDLLKRAGHRNIVPKENGAFAPLSLEFIIKADPDVIIELDPDGSSRPDGDASARRVWAKVGALRAVTSGRVRVLTGPEHFLLGPRIALTYDALCAAIAKPGDD